MSVTRLHFAEELSALSSRVVEMCRDVDNMLDLAMRALTDHSLLLAEKVLALDDGVDRLDLEIEMECMRLMALQQPMARDLRAIGTALKVITDLERIGDHAVDIAKVARKLTYLDRYEIPEEMSRLAHLVRAMLSEVMVAYTTNDLAMVDQVISADDVVDNLFHEVRDALHDAMRNQPEFGVQASHLVFVAHYLERVADHIVNIAERVHYAETGTLIRAVEER